MPSEELKSAVYALQQATSDEEILVGLTLLPRHVTESDELSMEFAYQNIPWSFIHRLLLGQEEMQKIGFYIWSGFCVEQFMSHSKFVKRLPPIVKLLTSEIDIKETILENIIVLALKNIKPFTVEIWTDILSVQETELQERVIAFIEQLLQSYDQEELLLFRSIAIVKLADWLETEQLLIQVLPVLVKLISLDKKLELDDMVLVKYKMALKRLLSSKLTKQVSEVGLVLGSFLAKSKRFLKLKTSSQVISTRGKLLVSDTKFIVILTHLVCAEIRVILDSTTKTLEKFDNELLPLYYSLLESIIGGMIDESFKLEYSELASVRTAMAETYLAVAAFLAERWDMYLETSNLQVLDNITTIFSMGSYSNWVAEENSVDVEELERLTPLVITICQKKYLKLSRFECIDFDPFELCQEILPLLTADPESSKLFMQESGDVMVIDKIKDITDHSVLLTLYAVLLNIVVSSDSTTLEMKHSVYGVIMPQLISTIESKVDLVVKAHAIVLFLFLYRSSRKYKKDKVPIDAIFEFISKRKKKFPSAANELWYLIVLSLHECLPKVMVDVEQKIATLEVTMAYLDDEEDVDVLTRLTDKLKNLL